MSLPVLHAVWVGEAPMSERRRACLASFHRSKLPVALVTDESLDRYLVPGAPLPAAYPYLSATGKSDVLRAYLLHHHGGGYSDIKETKEAWPLEDWQDPDVWLIGYPEIRGGVAPPLEHVWATTIGHGAYLAKPHTPLTRAWWGSVERVLALHERGLRTHPASHARDRSDGEKVSDYPLRWAELASELVHPIFETFKSHIRRTLPMPHMTDYQ